MEKITTMKKDANVTTSIRETIIKLKDSSPQEIQPLDYHLFRRWHEKPASPVPGKLLELWSDDTNDPDQNTVARDFLGQARNTHEVLTMVYRKEYERLTDRIVDEYNRNYLDGGVIVTGQPGIGKTWLLIWLVRLLLGQHNDFCMYVPGALYLFSASDGHPFEVYRYDGDLNKIHELRSGVPVLIDMETRKDCPPWQLTQKVFPIQASSPDVVRWKPWFKQKQSRLQLVMDIWSKDELCLAIQSAGLTEEMTSTLDNYTYRFGPVPRTVLAAIRNFKGECAQQDKHLRSMRENRTSLRLLFSKVISEEADLLSHSVVLVQSIPSSERGVPDDASHALLSDYLHLALKSLREVMDLTDAIHLYKLFSSHPKAAASAGWIFEGIMHQLLANSFHRRDRFPFQDPVLFISSTRGILSRDAHFPLISAQQVVVTFKDVDALKEALKVLISRPAPVDNSAPTAAVYLKPKSDTNPLFDSVVVTAPPSTTPASVATLDVWVLQMSRRTTHEASSAGLPLLENILTALRGLSSLYRHQFHYVYVFPKDEASKQKTWKLPKMDSHLQGTLHYLPVCLVEAMENFTSPPHLELVDETEDEPNPDDMDTSTV